MLHYFTFGGVTLNQLSVFGKTEFSMIPTTAFAIFGGAV